MLGFSSQGTWTLGSCRAIDRCGPDFCLERGKAHVKGYAAKKGDPWNAIAKAINQFIDCRHEVASQESGEGPTGCATELPWRDVLGSMPMSRTQNFVAITAIRAAGGMPRDAHGFVFSSRQAPQA